VKSESEEFCKDSFDGYLNKITPGSTIFWKEVERKDEPPEFYLSVDGTIYAVEVTILMQKVDVGAKRHLPVSIVRDLLRNFVVDEVEAVARKNSFLHGSYVVSFSKPITDFANIKSMIQSDLLSYISATQAISKAPRRVVYARGRQECRIVKVHTEENKVVMGGPVISRWRSEALVEAKQLLDNRLDEKQHRLKNIAYPKILLLHNKYYFADLDAYKACISTASSLRSFHTVFIVESNIEGQILYSQEPAWVPRPITQQ
jgi:hypothetical protein